MHIRILKIIDKVMIDMYIICVHNKSAADKNGRQKEPGAIHTSKDELLESGSNIIFCLKVITYCTAVLDKGDIMLHMMHRDLEH